jgi:Domain of unknown function (DUF4129)
LSRPEPVAHTSEGGRLQRWRQSRLAAPLAAAAVTISLAVAVFGLAGYGRVALSAAHPSASVVGSAALIALVASALLTAGSSLLRSGSRRGRPRRRVSWQVIVARLIVLFAVAYIWLHRRPSTRSPATAVRSPVTPTPVSHLPALGAPLGQVSMLVLVAVLVALVVLVGYGARHATPAEDPHERSEAAATAAVLARATLAGRAALDLGDDEREAIISCFQAMQVSLAERGVPERGADTAADLLKRAVDLGVVHSAAAGELVELFGAARFSRRPLPPGSSNRARAALDVVQAETQGELHAASSSAAMPAGPAPR